LTDLRLVVIGIGLIGKQRAAAADALEGVQLAATVDPRAQFSTEIPHYQRVEDVPPETYEAAIVSLPHHVATVVATDVLRQRKPVLIEKPLGTSAAAARELEQAASALDAPSFVGYNYRFLPTVRAVKAAVDHGQLGTLRSIDMLIGHGGHAASAEGWKLDPERAGGGVLLDPGVHLLDLLLQLLPQARFASIEATRGFWGTGIEEDVSIIFRTQNALATLRISHIRWVNAFRIEVFGEDGYALAEGRGGNYGRMTLRMGERWAWARREGLSQLDTEENIDFGLDNRSLDDELAAVVAAWRGEESPDTPRPATFAEARRVTELCGELYEHLD
jgi:predicted dehydrogenase